MFASFSGSRFTNRPLWRRVITIAMIPALVGVLILLAANFHPASPAVKWEKVSEQNDSQNYQVYDMTTYGNHLYIAISGFGPNARVKRYNGGSSWTQINPTSFNDPNNYRILSLASFNGNLFCGTDNPSTGAEVWAWDGSSWNQVNTDGFGDFAFRECNRLCVYNGSLYAGVYSNIIGGCLVFRYDGGTAWTQVNTPGFGDNQNFYIRSMIDWNGALWVGTENTSTGTEIWRYNGTTWTQANQDGFGIHDLACECFSVYNSSLYCGTWGMGGGCGRVYRFDGGNSWTPISSYGLGEAEDILSLNVFSSKIFAGTTHDAGRGGCQIWSYNGSSWTQENQPGFGDTANIQATTMADFDGQLYVGTKNWNGAQVWQTDGSPAPDVSGSSFYFAEGYTGENFQEYLCLGNPNAEGATVDVTYMFTDGTTQEAQYPVAPNSRYTVNVNSVVGPGREISIKATSKTSGLVAERPMYFNYNGQWTGGHDAVGALAPGKSWYFAEGTTLPEFTEYLTILNPGDQGANLTFRYMVESQGEVVANGTVGPHSRATFKATNQIGPNKNASLLIESDQNVVAERPMYFNYQGLEHRNWTGGHDVLGAPSPQKEWYFAEGTTRPEFEEWLCLQNPGTSAIKVQARYMLDPAQGQPVDKTYDVAAKQRLTVCVNRELGPGKDASVKLSSESEFIAERPMYFNYQGLAARNWTGGHDVLGANEPSKTWFFAEGYTGDNFEEWLCVQNPNDQTTAFTVTYYPESGSPIVKNWSVGPNARQTVPVNRDAGSNLAISAKIQSDLPVIAERPMYFNYNGQWTGGHDVVGLPSE